LRGISLIDPGNDGPDSTISGVSAGTAGHGESSCEE